MGDLNTDFNSSLPEAAAMDPNMMDTAASPPNFGSPQSPLEMKPDPNMIGMGQGIVLRDRAFLVPGYLSFVLPAPKG